MFITGVCALFLISLQCNLKLQCICVVWSSMTFYDGGIWMKLYSISQHCVLAFGDFVK